MPRCEHDDPVPSTAMTASGDDCKSVASTSQCRHPGLHRHNTAERSHRGASLARCHLSRLRPGGTGLSSRTSRTAQACHGQLVGPHTERGSARLPPARGGPERVPWARVGTTPEELSLKKTVQARRRSRHRPPRSSNVWPTTSARMCSSRSRAAHPVAAQTTGEDAQFEAVLKVGPTRFEPPS